MAIASALAFASVLPAAAEQVVWHQTFEEAVTAAEQSGRPILATFHSTGCGPCEQMKHETLGDADVTALIAESFEAVRVDAFKQSELATRYLVSFYPTVKFIDADGTTVYDCQGFVPPAEFLKVMERATEAHNALQRARDAAEREPENAHDALTVARDFLQARQHVFAAEWARRALDDEATAADARYVLGSAVLEAGEPAEAAESLESALTLADGPDWVWDAKMKLGYAWLQMGNEKQGLNLLQTVYGADDASEDAKSEAARLLKWWGVAVD